MTAAAGGVLTLELPDRETGGPLDVGTMTFVGTATVLVRFGGITFLTDPNFLHQGDHAHLGGGLRSRRLTEPALDIDDLPPLDFVLLSHHHGDHFDQIVIERLRKDVPIITTPQAARKLRRQGFRRPIALPTWERIDVRCGPVVLTIAAMPAKHAPQPLRALLPSVMGSMLDFTVHGARVLQMYITGDTLFFDGLAEIARRYPQIDLCIIHLGGTRIAGILLTMDAVQGVRALQVLRPATAVPVHYDDYTVFHSPLADFVLAAAAADLPTTIRTIHRGEQLRLPAP